MLERQRAHEALASCRSLLAALLISSFVHGRQSSVVSIWLSCRRSQYEHSSTRVCTLIPILEPDLNLSRAEPRDLPRQTLSMGSIGMRVSGELAHQESRLIMRQPSSRLLVSVARTVRSPNELPESLHLPLMRPEFSSRHWRSLPVFLLLTTLEVHLFVHHRRIILPSSNRFLRPWSQSLYRARWC